MGILSILLLILFVIVSLLLIFFVVIQDEDSDSIGGIFAGGSGSAFGSRSSNVVIRITYVLGALFFVCAFALAILNKSSTGNVEAAAAAATATTQQTGSTEWWNSGSGTQPGQGGAAPATETTVAPATK